MDAKDELTEKFLTVLEKIRLSETEKETAEAFLAGEAPLEALDAFTFEDLSGVPGDPAIRLFRELVKQEKRKLASRMLLVLLAKGASTCYRMVPMDMIDPEKGAVDTTLYAAQKAAAYAAILGADLYPLGAPSRDCLIQIAGGTPESLRQAMAFEKNASTNGKFILLAFYFFLKYQCGSNPDCMAAPKDLPLLGQYEEIAIESLNRLFPDSYSETAAIQDAVRNGQLTEEIRQLAAPKRGVSKQAVRLVGSLAYLNYPLSRKLKDIVKICLSAWMEEALNAMELVSLATSMDIYTRGGAYDREFGIAAKDYIRWVVFRGYEPVLEEQLARNTEAYFEVINEADYDAAGKMLSVIQKANAALYEEVIQNRKKFGYSKNFEKLLNKLIRNNADAPVIKAYLRGETSISSLYPIIDKYKDNYYSGAPERNVLDSALVSAREWDAGAWKELFTRNPMMHPFAIGLIWGVYENGNLLQSFRYMEDGPFNTELEEEYTFPANGKIRLVHPIELSEDSRNAWTQQLQDYEITQPIEQLVRPFYTITPEEKDQNDLLRFQGQKAINLFLGSKLAGLGWHRGLPEETGSFNSYYRRDLEAGMAAKLYFSRSSVSSGSPIIGENEEVAIERVCFHKYQNQGGGGKESKNSCFLKDVPIRYFSEIVRQLTKAIG